MKFPKSYLLVDDSAFTHRIRCNHLIFVLVSLWVSLTLQAQDRVNSYTFELEPGSELNMTISGQGLLAGVESSKQVEVQGTIETEVYLDGSNSIKQIRLKSIHLEPVETDIQYSFQILFATATIQMTGLELMMLEENAGPVSAVAEDGTFMQAGNQLSTAGNVQYDAGFLLSGSTMFDPDDLFEYNIEGLVSGDSVNPVLEFPILIRRIITSDDTELAEFDVQGILKARKGSVSLPNMDFTIEPLPDDPGKLVLRWPADASGTLSIANDLGFNNPEVLDIENLGGTFTVNKDPSLPMQFFKLTLK